MNREEIEHAVKMFQAALDGEAVEYHSEARDEWRSLSDISGPTLRIKPKPREFEIMVMGSGHIRDPSDRAKGYCGEDIKVVEVIE